MIGGMPCLVVGPDPLVGVHVEVLLALGVVACKVLPRLPGLSVVPGPLQRPHTRPGTVRHRYGDVGDLEKLDVRE